MLDVQQQILVEQRISNARPSAGVAYLLAIFLGVFGAHRFYLGRTGSALVMLLLTITVLGVAITTVWTLVDLFLIPGMIRENIEILRQKFTLEAMANSQPGMAQQTGTPHGPLGPASAPV